MMTAVICGHPDTCEASLFQSCRVSMWHDMQSQQEEGNSRVISCLLGPFVAANVVYYRRLLCFSGLLHCAACFTWAQSPLHSPPDCSLWTAQVQVLLKIYWPFFLYTWQDSYNKSYQHKWGGGEGFTANREDTLDAPYLHKWKSGVRERWNTFLCLSDLTNQIWLLA